jgi:hypothetical protein
MTARNGSADETTAGQACPRAGQEGRRGKLRGSCRLWQSLSTITWLELWSCGMPS